MEVLEEALERWTRVGLVGEEQARAIRAWEADHEGAQPTDVADTSGAATTRRDEDGGGLPWLGEGLAYVGAALALGAGAVVLGETWDDLGAPLRVLLAVLVTAALAAAARLLWGEEAPAGRRLATVLGVLAGVAAAGTVAIALTESTGLEDALVLAAAGAVVLAAVLPVHRDRGGWPTVLALGPGVLLVVLGLLDVVVPRLGQTIVGTVLAGLGLAWATAGWSGLARPRAPFEATGLAAGGVGCQVLATLDGGGVPWGLLVGIAVALGTVAVGVAEERTAPTVFGGLGLTVFAPQLVLRLVDGELAGPLSLLVTGLVLVAAAVAVLRTHREARP